MPSGNLGTREESGTAAHHGPEHGPEDAPEDGPEDSAAGTPAEVITSIIGAADAPDQAALLHRLEHEGAVDVLLLPRADLSRRRLRARSEAGRDVAIALPRDQQLHDGAVLRLGPEGALVVRVEAEEWLRVRPADAPAALRLGYHAGNLHWRVRFEGGDLLVALEGPEAPYRDRLAALVAEGAVRVVGDGGA